MHGACVNYQYKCMNYFIIIATTTFIIIIIAARACDFQAVCTGAGFLGKKVKNLAKPCRVWHLVVPSLVGETQKNPPSPTTYM